MRKAAGTYTPAAKQSLCTVNTQYCYATKIR